MNNKIIEILKRDEQTRDIYGEFSHQSVNIPLFEEIVPEKILDKNDNDIEAFSKLEQKKKENIVEEQKNEEIKYRQHIEENNRLILEALRSISAPNNIGSNIVDMKPSKSPKSVGNSEIPGRRISPI